MRLNLQWLNPKYPAMAAVVFLTACCGLCTRCPADAECATTPANAATNIKSRAGGRPPPDNANEPIAPGARLPEGWRVSYPLFEGDYFSVTLPATPPDHPDEEDRPVVSPAASPVEGGGPDEVMEPEGSGEILVAPAANPLVEARIRRARAEAAVREVVSHMGFAESSNPMLDDEFFGVAPHVLHSGGGDILKVAQVNCQTGPQPYPNDATSFCNMDPDQQRALIEEATGMTADDYLDRSLIRYSFFQRPQHREWPPDPESAEELCAHYPNSPGDCLQVFIEHVALAATFRRDNTVHSVTGRVYSNYRITNNPTLTPAAAVDKAYQQLWAIPRITQYASPPPIRRSLPMVLLPYAHSTRVDWRRLAAFRWPAYRTPQLRYAYRTTLWGDYVDEAGRLLEGASWRAWIDAETGDILQLIPQFAFAERVEAKGKGWSTVHPSRPVQESDGTSDDWPTDRVFLVDKPGSTAKDCECPGVVDPSGQFCLKLAGVFDQIEAGQIPFGDQEEVTPKFLCSGSEDFTVGLTCASGPWDCLCLTDDLTPLRILFMNAYAHVYAYKQKLDNTYCHSGQGTPLSIPPTCVAGEFQTARSQEADSYVPLRVRVGDDSLGIYEAAPGSPHLTFGEIDEAFLAQACDQLGLVTGERPGAQDATIMTHEFAHVLMDGLLASRKDDWCGEGLACPVPLDSDIVHDLADGLSAVSNRSQWFGAWWGNDDPETKHNEHGGTIRKFEPAVDHFPEHRDWDQIAYHSKGYADGQIGAAAIWAVTESMHGWGGEHGRAAFETALLNALPSHFIPKACRAFEQGAECDYPDDCDVDVYRYLHFLLNDLIRNDIAAGVSVTSNKVAAGFAEAGIFLVPPGCIGATTSADPVDAANDYCPSGPYGGDAVVNITDDWLSNGSGNSPLEVPVFRVWTGPRFRFQGDRADVVEPSEMPCNPFYKITIANNPEFQHDESKGVLSRDTAWLEAEDCEATWSHSTDSNPDPEWMAFWAKLAATSPRAYYRVVTSDSNAANAPSLSSSQYPGKAFFNTLDVPVDPPFAILNGTGEFEPTDDNSPN